MKGGRREEWTCTERQRHMCTCDYDGEVDFTSILKGVRET